MLNALNFLNSKDIRQYWQEINYQPSAAETAWLIWQSHNHTMSEKHQAWQQLISESDDTENFLSPNYTLLSEKCGITSLHEFLREYMRVENELAKQFFNNEPCCYAILGVEHANGWFRCIDDMAYRSLDDFARKANLFDSDDILTISAIEYQNGEIADNDRAKITAWMKPDMTIMRVSAFLTGNYDYALLNAFRGMWFNFPVPFKKGDLVTGLDSDEINSVNYHARAVIIKTMNDRANEPNNLGVGGNDDFYAIAYHIDTNGRLEAERFTDLMNCEYYTDSLFGYQRQLKTISSFLKGDIDELLMMKAIRKIQAEAAVEAIDNELLNYTYSDEEYRLAGLDV